MPLRPRHALLLLAGACADPPPVERAPAADHLRQGELSEYELLEAGRANHLLPVKVAIDPVRRRAWSLSASVGSIAEVDLDSAALVDVHPLPAGISFDHPEITVDGDGAVWVGHEGDPWLLRLSGGEVTTWPGFGQTRALLGRPEGGVVMAGAWSDRSGLLMLDGDGSEVAFAPQDGVIGSLAWTARGLAAMVSDAGGLQVVLLGASDLSELDSIDAPLYATGMAGLEDGALVTASVHTVAVIASDGTASEAVPAGNENTTVVDLGSGEFLVLDRNGGSDPTTLEGNFWGVARRFDESLQEVASPMPTGFNSGFGGLDPVTGLLWVNSEGTTELWAIDPDSGKAAAKVGLGVHVEMATADPARPAVAWFTGRLNGTIGRVDLGTGEVTTRAGISRWPVCPVVQGGVLWVLDEITAVLYGLDPDTLEPLLTWDTGLGENPALVFNQLAGHPERGTLLVAHAWDNTLVEIDPNTGDVLGSWLLAGPALETTDNPGRLEVAVVGDRVVTHRTLDGMLTVVDLDLAESVARGHVPPELMPALDGSSRLQRLASDVGERRFYVGGLAFDRDTLLHEEQADLPVTYVAGQVDEGGWIGLTTDGLALLDPDGELVEVLDLGIDDTTDVTFSRVGDQVLFTDYVAARLGVVDIGAFEGL